VLRHMVSRSRQRSADSIAEDFQTSTGINNRKYEKNCAAGASWNGFPWPSSQVQCQVLEGVR